MKTLKAAWISLLVFSTMVSMAAQEFRTDINPALLYYRALLVQGDPVPEADWNYLSSKKGLEQKLPERFGKIAAGYDNQFLLVRQAAKAKAPCDWGIDLSPGPNVIMPHLARARALARTAQLRALWALQDGRQEAARDDLLATFTLARHLASDGLLISAFVQFAIEGLEYGTIARHYGDFSPETLKQLVDGFDSAPARRTLAGCMPSEKGMGDWTLRQIRQLQQTYPNDDAKVMATFRQCGIVEAMEFLGESNFWPRLIAASGGSSEGAVKLLREAESVFPRLAEVLALPYPEFEARAQQLSSEIQKSGNPFAAGFKLILDGRRFRVRPAEFRAEAQLAMVRAAGEFKRTGEAGMKSVTDPFGKGPFSYRRFVFKGVDRGFELKSAYAGDEAPFAMIFVEKKGPAFHVTGPDAGKAVTK
jgi:hypothetical protein